MKSAIIIPAHRAAKTLPDVVGRVPEQFWQNGIAIVVNDCSPDETGAVAEQLIGEYSSLSVIHHQRNTGCGGAVKSGLRRGLAGDASAFVIVHADGQYPPEYIMEMLAPVANGEGEIVQGSRMLRGDALKGGMPLVRFLANRALTFVENAAFGTSLAEFHSGYMVYSRKLLEEVPFQRLQDNFNFDAEMILFAHLLGYRCKEIAIPTRYDAESSSLSPIPYGINVLKMIGRHRLGHYRSLLQSK